MRASWWIWHGARAGVGGWALDPASREVGSMDAYHVRPLCRNPSSLFWKNWIALESLTQFFGSHFHDKAIVPHLPSLLLFMNVGKRGYKKGPTGARATSRPQGNHHHHHLTSPRLSHIVHPRWAGWVETKPVWHCHRARYHCGKYECGASSLIIGVWSCLKLVNRWGKFQTCSRLDWTVFFLQY